MRLPASGEYVFLARIATLRIDSDRHRGEYWEPPQCRLRLTFDVDTAEILTDIPTQVGANLVIAAPHDHAHPQRCLEPSVSEELADRTRTAALLVARSAGSVLLTRPPRPG